MLTGRCPFAGRNPAQLLAQILSDDLVSDIRDVVPAMPPDLAVLIRRKTIKDRKRRMSSLKALF